MWQIVFISFSCPRRPRVVGDLNPFVGAYPASFAPFGEIVRPEAQVEALYCAQQSDNCLHRRPGLARAVGMPRVLSVLG
jgi:hypothetical protein